MKRKCLQPIKSHFVSVLLLYILLFTAFIGTASAEAIIRVSPQVQAAEAGERFTVDLYVEPDEPIAGIQLDFTFDSSLVSVEDIREGDLLKQPGSDTMFIPGDLESSQGTVKGIYGFILGKDEATAQGIFASIDLTSTGGNGVGELQLSSVIVSDSNGHAVKVRVINGTAGTENAEIPSTEKPSEIARSGDKSTEKELSGENLIGENSTEEILQSSQYANSPEDQDLELEEIDGESSNEAGAALSSGSENIQDKSRQENQEYYTLTGIMGAGVLFLAALFCLRKIKNGKN